MRIRAKRAFAVTACVALSLCLIQPAVANWPRPAGGESASGDPEVLFTFDDGPHQKHTKRVLDELGRRGMQAIFFWVGHRISRGKKVEERLALVRRAVREGHLVANHTVSHPNLCQVTSKEVVKEIDENARLFEQASGLPMVLFRVPYGAKCKRLVRILESRSLEHMHWDIDPQEWSDHDAKRSAKYIIRKLRNLDGRAIVILHDTHKVTADTLPIVLNWIELENERRRKRKDKRPIRVLSGSDLVFERMERGIIFWALDAFEDTSHRLHSAVSRLII